MVRLGLEQGDGGVIRTLGELEELYKLRLTRANRRRVRELGRTVLYKGMCGISGGNGEAWVTGCYGDELANGLKVR
jgi:hypothetical protein